MKDWKALEPDKYALVGGHRFTRGRSRPIDRVVVHHNAGVRMSTEDCKRLWDEEREASAHYQVEEDGTIGQLVNDSDTAWHAANADINARSIGIEHANIGGPPRWQISDKTIEEGAHLVAALCHAYKLGRPAWGINVFGHSQFASTSCPHQLAPGGEDHDTYMKRAQWWYDNFNSKQAAPAAESENGMNLFQSIADFIKGFVGPIGLDVKAIRRELTGGRDEGQYPGFTAAYLLKNIRAKGYDHLTLVDMIALLIWGTDADRAAARKIGEAVSDDAQ
ncbi:peptidoglycan recognition family protein [Corynebacterium sp. H127]|uniref:peptidoglycan recognition protein family protein n=1 Tax=Corynebacterium sp. H127 TaxID=3133418 RepID=UPI0030B404CC